MRLAGVALVLAMSGVAAAQELDAAMKAKVDAAVQRVMKADGAPSVSVAVVRGDRVVYAAAFGAASMERGVKATTATRYQLASVSKTFTAQAVLLLQADGKLSLDDRVARWFPEVTGAKDITLRQLLSHTGGLPDSYYPMGYPAGERGAAVKPDAIIARWGKDLLLSAPGAAFHYSNLDYQIAGRVVEKVSGKPLWAFLQERVFAPVGMTSAIDLDTVADGSDALATGYVRDALGPLVPAAYEGPGWSFGAGQVVTTATDLAKWDAAFLQGKVLPAKEAAEEVTRVPLTGGGTGPEGIGLFVGEEDGVRRYYHSGQGLGFTSINMIYPQERVAFAVLTNTSVTGTVGRVTDELAYLLIPPGPKEAFARKVFAQMQAGAPDAALLAPDLKAYLTAARLARYRTTLMPLGAVESFVAGRSSMADGLESRDYDVVAGGRSLKLHLLLRADGLLEDVAISDAEPR